MSSVCGIGLDIIEVSRFSPDKTNRDLLAQIFTSRERSQTTGDHAQYFSTLFAAKEAFFKALGTGLHYGSYWRNIQITNKHKGKVSGPLNRFLKNAARIHISQSSTRHYALSIVVIEK